MHIGEIYIYFTKKSISSTLQVNMVISFCNKGTNVLLAKQYKNP